MNKKKILKIIIIIFVIVFISILAFKLYNYLRIKYAKVEVTLVSDMTLQFYDKKKVSDYVESINGKIINDYTIDSTKLGKKNIKFKFINDDGIKIDYNYEINVVDTVSPVVWLDDSYSIRKGSESNFYEDILCADNYDSNPKCEIIGEYDLNIAGSYPLIFKATDSSNNVTEKKFNLNVYESSNKNNNSNSNSYTKFSDIVKEHKNENTKIGIDVSVWQGDIDFEKIKKAGVEFIIIRVGSGKGKGKDYYFDSKFTQNIENANKYGIDVGIYFYSYAQNEKEAVKEAKWVLDKIKDYDISLPIVFDWEDFGDFNSYNLSLFCLTNIANEFINTVEKAGYKGMIYGSKNYLEKIWLPTDHEIWLAHYTTKTSYEGEYKIWQRCNDGIVDGIDGYVDINIMYN